MEDEKDLLYILKYRNELKDIKEYTDLIFAYLNLEPIDIFFRDIEEEGRYYIKENYIVVSTKLAGSKVELLKTISHEARHYYQLVCVNQEDNDDALVTIWRKELQAEVTEKTIQEEMFAALELDAYSFSKFILKKLYGIKFEYSDLDYDDLVNWYINKFF